METIKWFSRWCVWPLIILQKLEKDHGAHQVVLSGMACLFGMTAFASGIIPLIIQDFPFPSRAVNLWTSFISFVIYFLGGLFFYFDGTKGKETSWQERGVW